MGDNQCMNSLNDDATQWIIIAVTMWTGLIASTILALVWWRQFSSRRELDSYGIPWILGVGVTSQIIGIILFYAQ